MLTFLNVTIHYVSIQQSILVVRKEMLKYSGVKRIEVSNFLCNASLKK